MRRFSAILILILLSLSLSACVSVKLRRVDFELTRFQLESASEQRFKAGFTLYNKASSEVELASIHVKLTVDERIHLAGEQNIELNIPGGGRESVDILLAKSDRSKIMILANNTDTRESIPYKLELEYRQQGGASRLIREEGMLYRVPGKSWHFRG